MRENFFSADCDDLLHKPFQKHAFFEMCSYAALPAELLERLSIALAGLEVDEIGKIVEGVLAIDP